MPHYIALIHKDRNSCHGVSFPDLPACSRPRIRSTRRCATPPRCLEFAAEDWPSLDERPCPAMRSIDALRADANLQDRAEGAVIAAVPFRTKAEAAE
jgi:antitoxin HicB